MYEARNQFLSKFGSSAVIDNLFLTSLCSPFCLCAAEHWLCSSQYLLPPGPQQTQYCRFAAVGPCWDRQADRWTDTIPLHRPCFACYVSSANLMWNEWACLTRNLWFVTWLFYTELYGLLNFHCWVIVILLITRRCLNGVKILGLCVCYS